MCLIYEKVGNCGSVYGKSAKVLIGRREACVYGIRLLTTCEDVLFARNLFFDKLNANLRMDDAKFAEFVPMTFARHLNFL
jgi:hypothetical protein